MFIHLPFIYCEDLYLIICPKDGKINTYSIKKLLIFLDYALIYIKLKYYNLAMLACM